MSLDFLCTPSREVAAELAGGASLVLLADHLEGERAVLLFRVDDLDAALGTLEGRGWHRERSFEIPHGPCCAFEAPGGHRIALYQLTRPEVAAHSRGDETSETLESVIRPLTVRTLRSAARRLAADDPALAASLERFGPPPLWAREPSYATLVHLILEQQVSLASAQAAFDKLTVTTGTVTPDAFLALDDAQLRAIGFSRQKAGYARDLALALTDGFDLNALGDLPDDDVRARLIRLRGIGRWTADVYLTMCLLRPDVWPHGDQALATASMEVFGTHQRPTFMQLSDVAERWRPYRAVAARMLWHHYLRVRGLPVD